MRELAGSNVVVVGLGLSGASAAELCLRRGARVVGVDQRPRHELAQATRELAMDVRLQDQVGKNVYEQADLVVLSPGVVPSEAILRAERGGTETVGELELAARLCQAPLIAVGGTNGKSTTTELVATMLEADGRRVFRGGNLGTPLSQAVDGGFDVLVVEVSSFQLERAPEFRPRVSVLLNVTEDHLDRHGTFAEYAAAKGNAFANQKSEDVAVALAGDAEVARQVARGCARVVEFGPSGDYVVEAEAVVESPSGERFALDGALFSNRHVRYNAAAAMAAARAVGASSRAVAEGLSSHRALPHRLQLVGRHRGVSYYDDSKATNVGAAVAAVLGLAEPRIVLIAGGQGKQGSYVPLARALRRRGRAVVLMGQAAALMSKELEGALPLEFAVDMQDAVRRASRLASAGDAVLLSPACASFDMFDSYAHRGRCFAEAARALSQPPLESERRD